LRRGPVHGGYLQFNDNESGSATPQPSMASIASHTIYSKTAKGLAEVTKKTGKLSRELTAILEAVDGKARFSELQAECGMTRPEMQRALEALAMQGLIQEVATGIHQAAGAKPADDDTADLDFSSPDAIAKFNKQAERELRMQAEKRTETGAKTRPEMDPRKRAEAEVARARAQAEVKKRMEAAAKKRAEAEAKTRAEVEAKALAEAAKHASAEEARPAEDEFQRRAREEAELREREEARASGRSAEEIQALEDEKRRAREEAAAKARAEAEAKARVEAEAKARVEAEAKARVEAEAKARAEAEAKVRAEAEAKARVEAEAKARVEAEAKARADAEAKARAEAELKARVEAEVKARVEAKAKALAEAEAKRAETEAKARAEAERRAREEAERREREEAARREREEAERRAREEAERRAREEAEAKARAHEELRARAEALAHARAQEERRAREEADAKARQEAARRALEEAAAAVRAVEVPNTRDTAEAKKLEEQDRQAAAGAPGFREADSWAHLAAASAGAGHADKTRMDATAAGEAAESGQRLVAPSATDLVRKLKAKVQAEWRARGDSKGPTLASPGDSELSSAFPTATASVPSETDAPDISAALRELNEDPASRDERPVEEHVPSALESAMLHASVRNEPTESSTESRRDSDRGPADELGEPTPRDFRAMDSAAIPLSSEHQRVNADRAAYDVLAHAANERHQVDAALGHGVVDEDARRSARALRKQRQTKVLAALGILLVAAPVLATAWLQFVPLNSYIPEAQQALSEQLNQPTTISSLRYVQLTTPRVVLEGVKVGKGIHIDRVDAPALPQALSSVPPVFDTVSAHGLTIQSETLGAIPDWKTATSSRGVRVKRLVLEGVKIEGADAGLPMLNGEITFTADGTPRQAAFTSEKLKLDVGPEPNGLRIVLTAQDSRIPFGPQVKFSHLSIAGVAARKRFTSTEMSAGIGSGVLTGTLQASWEGQITVAGDFKVQRVRLQEFAPLVAADFAGSGVLTASGHYTFQSPAADTLMARPVVEATFSLARGELPNIDLLRATQSSGSNSFSGGRTMFEEVKGSLQIAGGQYSYRLQLSSGPLNASGNLAVAPSGQLSGRVTAVLTAHGAEVARTALNVGGTVKEPQLAQ
jgi:hypothetical protein